MVKECVDSVPLGTPTHHKPGSDEKIFIFCDRYDKGLSMWHPEDEKELITKEEHNAKTIYITKLPGTQTSDN